MRIALRKWLAIDNTNFDKSAKGANCKKKLILLVKCLPKKCSSEFFLIQESKLKLLM